MKIPEPCQTGRLIRRYKRFLADIQLPDGTEITVHCPNSGSMLGCSTPGSEVLISRAANPRRKYHWTLEMIKENGCWIGINTSLTNKLIREALENGIIDDFGQVETIYPEVRVSPESRLDFLVEARGRQHYIEVKNCSLVENGVALFPDAVTLRGQKHLRELDRLREAGFQTAIIFCVQREDAACFAPAAAIDPEYAATLYAVNARGVSVIVCQAEITPEQVRIVRKIPLCRENLLQRTDEQS